MTILVSYRKNFVQGPLKGEFAVEVQPLSSWVQSINFRRLLSEISKEAPAKDPVTGYLCYVSDIEAKESNHALNSTIH